MGDLSVTGLAVLIALGGGLLYVLWPARVRRNV